jgi:ABC-2 type transport system ATP-binding protein
MIRIDNLKKSYGDSVVFAHVNASFEEGRIHGLLGLNGAGKSTLLRLIAGVYSADEGTIALDGQSLEANPKLKERIFFLADDPYYSATATVKDVSKFYASFYPKFSKEELTKNLQLLQVTASGALASFSKGMRRKVYIAMAFASGCEILLLDEVFDGLDPTARIVFKKMLADFISAKKENTVLIASHSLRELEDIADSFTLIKDGEVQSALYQEGESRLYKVQLAFAELFDPKKFSGIDVRKVISDGKFLTLFVKGKEEDIEKYLRQFSPLLIQIQPATLEETFIEETEASL